MAFGVVLTLRGPILPQRYSMGVHYHVHTEPVCRPLMSLYLCTPYTVQERGSRKHGHQYNTIHGVQGKRDSQTTSCYYHRHVRNANVRQAVQHVEAGRAIRWLSPDSPAPPPSIVSSTSYSLSCLGKAVSLPLRFHKLNVLFCVFNCWLVRNLIVSFLLGNSWI